MSSPVPPSPSVSIPGPRPLQLVDGNLQAPAESPCPSPAVSGLSTPPPSARKFNSRRQSSITYYPSDHTPNWEVRSPTATAPGPSSLRRTASLSQNVPARLNLKRDRRSLPVAEVEAVGNPLTERPPLTLTEKHADLLRFIAQKESKCLELRSQLAAHEAELAQLKRKWERIVSRGMDRAYSQQPTHSGSSSLLTGAVKDVSRLLAAGLSDLSTSPAPASPRLSSKANRASWHANTQSVSSTATSTTSASLTSSSVRLSQSSASSFAYDDVPEEDEREGAPASISSSDHSASIRRSSSSVRVDGGTGIESPIEISSASALKAAKLHRRKSRDAPPPSSYPLASAEPDVAKADSASTRSSAKRSSLPAGSSKGAAGLPPAASIPGLGPLASPLASAWMGSVGTSVGKKWGEIQKGETFTKSQKRASLLFSDAASSLFAALTSPSSSSPAPTPSGVSVTSNPFSATISPMSTSPVSRPSPVPSASSLLDDDSDATGLGSVLVPDSKSPLLTPTLVPSPAYAAATSHSASAASKSKDLLDDDDDWNW
ncbi:hypothetical protein BD311DRAFT_67953 [Dichomitus squalens]|uniref:Uncharacterized protein n=1 Tax=Dichomitus squalens TaxID=114155 RepID=A0A4Q9MB12_9APHY|nr:hypothetical protein BD311DRAFT_67953 [Dichomitus squalens]